MEITVKFLKDERACTEGVDWFKNQNETEHTNVINALKKEGYFNWANWLIVRLLTHPKQIQYAIFAAEQVIEIFEKEFPNDKRPRMAIEAARLVFKKDNKENRAAAGEAARAAGEAAGDVARTAARAAAWAARDASWAARDAAGAARDASWAAGSAAWAAGEAAKAVAMAAARAAARKEMQSKILNYGLKLLEKK